MTPPIADDSALRNGDMSATKNDRMNGDQPQDTEETVIVRPVGGKHSQGTAIPSYVKCNSRGDFINPFADAHLPAHIKNDRLNLNLGQRWVSPDNQLLVWVIRFFNSLCIEWWEIYLFALWKTIPLSLRRTVTFAAWKIYFPLHKALLGRRTGLHPDASDEYHALTTFMWWGRLFPVSVRRMRFSLNQLPVCAPSMVQAKHTRHIREDMKDLLSDVPTSQKDHVTVKGIFLENEEKPTEWTIFWVYGGAFIGGDTEGNSATADYVGRACGMDVFLPEYRLVPEYQAQDIVWDICLAYRWLCQRRDPNKILLLGISSGAALCLILMQNLAKQARGETEELLPTFVQPALHNLTMPAGCTLLGPFCDLTEPSGALLHYQKHDLIVNQRVFETGLPFFESHIPAGQRKMYSPIYQSCQGLPPLCVAVSEHEVTYDMTKKLIDRARREGVLVSVGVWRFMCHVFSFLSAFCPEGEQSMEFCIQWIRQQAYGDKKNN